MNSYANLLINESETAIKAERAKTLAVIEQNEQERAAAKAREQRLIDQHNIIANQLHDQAVQHQRTLSAAAHQASQTIADAQTAVQEHVSSFQAESLKQQVAWEGLVAAQVGEEREKLISELREQLQMDRDTMENHIHKHEAEADRLKALVTQLTEDAFSALKVKDDEIEQKRELLTQLSEQLGRGQDAFAEQGQHIGELTEYVNKRYDATRRGTDNILSQKDFGDCDTSGCP